MGPVSVVDWFLMNFVLRPWQLFFLILSGWLNRQQQEIIEFQNAQIQALIEKMGRKRILLTDDQRRVLAVKGKALGRKTMMELTTIVTPNTIFCVGTVGSSPRNGTTASGAAIRQVGHRFLMK